MHGLALIYTVRDLPGVERFRIEQMSLDLTSSASLPDRPSTLRPRSGSCAISRRAWAMPSPIRVERVPVIAAESSGKFRYVVSQVKAPGSEQGRCAMRDLLLFGILLAVLPLCPAPHVDWRPVMDLAEHHESAPADLRLSPMTRQSQR
jgi:hypothetical protein